MTYEWEKSAAKAIRNTGALNVNLPENMFVFGVFVVNVDTGEGAYIRVPCVEGVLHADALRDALHDATNEYSAVVAGFSDQGMAQ